MILDLVNNTKAEIALDNDEIKGTISIAAGETPGMNFLAQNMKLLHAKFPKIKFNITSCIEDNVRYLLKTEVCDFGVLISASEIGLQEFSYLTTPYKNRWGVCVRPNSPLYEKEQITASDLKNIPLLFSSQALKTNEFKSWLNFPISKLDIVATYNLPQNALLLTQAGIGDMVCLEDCVNIKESSNIKFIPLKPALEASVFLVWKQQRQLGKAALQMLSLLRKEIDKSI